MDFGHMQCVSHCVILLHVQRPKDVYPMESGLSSLQSAESLGGGCADTDIGYILESLFSRLYLTNSDRILKCPVVLSVERKVSSTTVSSAFDLNLGRLGR